MPTSISKADVREGALASGFDAVGIVAPDGLGQAARHLRDFLAGGLHGDMAWMAANAERRADPRTLWPAVRSIIVVGLNYAQRERHGLDGRDGPISVYAQGRDYHTVFKKRLKTYARWIAETSGAEVKVFVDTAPVMEKPLAARAGLGWQGKHTNLVSRDLGSWLFLGSVFTTLALAPDAPERDHCGACRACLDVCPTNAFPAPYRLDARRCISYLTIEHKGHIAREFRTPMGNRIYGCDDCLSVCPWNKFARAAATSELRPRDDLAAPALAELAGLDEPAFRRRFAGTAIKRTGRDRFVRNVLIALGNTGDSRSAEAAMARLDDRSPLVRAMAVWALSRLLDPPAFAAIRADHAEDEPDRAVRAEWREATAALPQT